MSSLFEQSLGPSPKIHITSGPLPSHFAASQAPTKRLPWRAIRDVDIVHSTTAVLPDELYQVIWQDVENGMADLQYAKVSMKVEELLSGAFFNDHVKRGNVLMLSEGRPGVDNVFSLRDGTLRLELLKEDYERAGLQGVSVRSGGRKHLRTRYLVQIDLRQPSMLHGKKGFERLLWAAKNVLNQSLNWVFVDLSPDNAGIKGPILQHHPIVQKLTHSTQSLTGVLIPQKLLHPFDLLPSAPHPSPCSEDLQESLYELFEYLDLLVLGSARVRINDDADSFISRYAVPETLDHSQSQTQNIKVVKWSGVISIKWILDLFCAIITQSRTSELAAVSTERFWLALSVTAPKSTPVGGKDGYTIVLHPDSYPSDHTLDHNESSTAADAPRHAEDGITQDAVVSNVVPVLQAQTQVSIEHGPIIRTGFQRYLCAEYTDSMTGL